MRVFKQRLIETLAYLISVLMLIGICYGICSFFNFVFWVATLPIVGIVVRVGFSFLVIVGVCVAGIEFINWLIVEPYRNHKRKRETEGSAE